ncbi:hypothetical protein INP57_19735 [Saccharopolyspora sp. HNM0986]|uniref:hypothetical protein n=1 Tax=Saccharopolyspora galaxeae TaxID=2781241 RepID=UPI00190D6038|nr:hypothetical protein [Saccharopolyspora sp. HNM0986]MBK0869043.1 hypothetical protein [Saccharopolyspora sp. HNM0986]
MPHHGGPDCTAAAALAGGGEVASAYFGKATHDFAARNERIRLIEGPELKHLLKEHLDLDVVIGAKIPNRKN